jgi:hypothetical protein
MKLVFNKSPQGLELAYVECVSTEEADKFQSWFASKVTGGQKFDAETVEALAEVAAMPTPEVEKVTRNDVSQAAIALVQTKGRPALNPILEGYNAKRISEIPEDKLAGALADIKRAQQ